MRRTDEVRISYHKRFGQYSLEEDSFRRVQIRFPYLERQPSMVAELPGYSYWNGRKQPADRVRVSAFWENNSIYHKFMKAENRDQITRNTVIMGVSVNAHMIETVGYMVRL